MEGKWIFLSAADAATVGAPDLICAPLANGLGTG